jgi:hypothetical protein
VNIGCFCLYLTSLLNSKCRLEQWQVRERIKERLASLCGVCVCVCGASMCVCVWVCVCVVCVCVL